MLRALALVLLALAALVAAGCSVTPDAGTGSPPRSQAASPQSAELGWNETFREEGGPTTFRVHRFAVLHDGWEADVSLTNGTTSTLAVGDPDAPLSAEFGLMLFPTGDLSELERLNQAGDLPPVRRAREFDPPLPAEIRPGGTWRGTLRGRGALAAGRFVRLVFGTLVPEGATPKGYPSRLLWITDNAYELTP